MTKINVNQLGSSNLTQPKKVFTPINRKPTDNLPKSKAWLNNISGKVTDDKKPELPKEKFWVTKSSDSSKISDEVLKKHFNFDDNDIKAYTKKNGKFTITDSGKCEIATKNNKVCAAATKEDILGKPDKTGKLVGGWTTENGKVAVTLSAERVKELQNFRQERVIDKSLSEIKDPLLRQDVKSNLANLALGEGQTRVDAANKLMNMDVQSPVDAETIRRSITNLASQPENKNNATAQILSAKINLNAILEEKDKEPSLMFVGGEKSLEEIKQKVARYEVKLDKATDLAGGKDNFGGRNLKTTREEASFVNNQAADIYDKLGNKGKAEEREMMSRYYKVDNKERESFEFKVNKPIVNADGSLLKIGTLPKYKSDEMKASDGNVPQPKPIETEKPVKETKLSEDPFKRKGYKIEQGTKVFEQTFRGKQVTRNTQQGSIVTGYKTTFEIKGSVKVEGNTVTNWKETQTKFGKKIPEKRITTNREITVTQTTRGTELNPSGTTNAFGVSGGVNALGKWQGAVNFKVEGDKATARIAEKDRANREVFLKNNYPIPPEPRDLSKVKLNLERTFGKFEGGQIYKVLEEASYAVYGKK